VLAVLAVGEQDGVLDAARVRIGDPVSQAPIPVRPFASSRATRAVASARVPASAVAVPASCG
jgi:hypothetical protein